MNKLDWLGYATTWSWPKDEMYDSEVQQGPSTWDSSPKYKWEKWFAWHPVKVHGNRQWLKTVYRKVEMRREDVNIYAHYSYGDIFDVIKDESEN